MGPRRPDPSDRRTDAIAPEDGAPRAPKVAPIPEHVYDATNERVVLCAALADRKTRDVLTRTIAADEFLVAEHAPLWRALRAMTDRALEPDGRALRRLAADEGEVSDEYVAGLESEAGIPTNLDHVVETLRWDATRARVIRGAVPELIRDLRNPKASPETVASAARAVLRSVEGGGGRRFMRRAEDLQRSYRAEIAARSASGNFYSLGMGEPMDRRLVEGAMPRRTAVVAGLSGSGKSTWVANMVLGLAREGRRVLLGAWEMNSESYLDVMVSGMARIELTRVVQGSLTPDEVSRIGVVTKWITERVKFFDNPFFAMERTASRGRRTNERNLDLIEGYIAESGCDVVVMDLWERGLIDLSYDGVTSALYAQQNMHERYNVWGVIVNQLRGKDVERRADKRPTRDAIKGTGAYVEVADLIFGIHREAQFKRVPDDSIEAINLKQRKGEAFWAVRYDWRGDLALISGGTEVPYDPGLEASAEFGDGAVGSVAEIRTKNRRKPTRRDG